MLESREIPEKILSFEDFRKRNEYGFPKYNNFIVFFTKNKGELLSYAYDNNLYFLKFKENHELLFNSMNGTGNEIQKLFNNSGIYLDINMEIPEKIKNRIDEIEDKFYEAYKIMKSYGAEDSDLFK